MQPKAVNTCVWIIKDKPVAEKGGLVIPGVSREKPHTGTVFSIGSKVTDKEIKGSKNKKAIFFKGIGQTIEYQGVEYLVMQENEIIGIDDPSQ